LLKTHSLLVGKDHLELSDFRALFEIPVQNAMNKKADEIAEKEKTYL
jgi:hypothetical protein